MDINTREELRGHFRGHPYYKLCCAVQDKIRCCAPVVLSKEQLFADAATTLDRLLAVLPKEVGTPCPERCRELCEHLWDDTQERYRSRDGNASMDTIQAEVAMLHYALVMSLCSVDKAHERPALEWCVSLLHNRVQGFWGEHQENGIDTILDRAYRHYEKDMQAWMADYFCSSDSLTEEIGRIAEEDTACGADIPQDCKEAVTKVFQREFHLKNGGVRFSVQQMRKAAKVINPSSNVEVALLMAVAKEVGAVYSGSTCTDFVRALIGLGILKYSDKKDIENRATAMSGKINGRKRNKDKPKKALKDYHKNWEIDKDRKIGEKIFEAMTSV